MQNSKQQLFLAITGVRSRVECKRQLKKQEEQSRWIHNEGLYIEDHIREIMGETEKVMSTALNAN